MRLRPTALPLLAIVLAAAPGAAAQDRGGTVPEEFVRAMFAGYGEGVEVVVGRLPEGIPGGALPSGARALGGLSHPGGATAVVAVPTSPEDALAAYAAQMERAAGWRRAGQPQQPTPQGAFASTPLVDRMVVLCGEGGVLRPSTVPRREGGSYLRLTLDRGPQGSACRREAPARQGDETDVPFPTLQPLPGSMTRGGGGGSSSSNGVTTERRWTAHIEASASPADIAAHYAAELRRAGWTVGAPAATPGASALTADLRDAQGQPWRGVLTVVAKPGSAREAGFTMMLWGPQ